MVLSCDLWYRLCRPSVIYCSVLRCWHSKGRRMILWHTLESVQNMTSPRVSFLNMVGTEFLWEQAGSFFSWRSWCSCCFGRSGCSSWMWCASCARHLWHIANRLNLKLPTLGTGRLLDLFLSRIGHSDGLGLYHECFTDLLWLLSGPCLCYDRKRISAELLTQDVIAGLLSLLVLLLVQLLVLVLLLPLFLLLLPLLLHMDVRVYVCAYVRTYVRSVYVSCM